ncbi:hypothetical protein OS187_09910 [Xanthomonadaceae bacterium JHOS43]|nr:hypothetical protein [Xanthomonadaceae bacterium JHOS43]MCX7564098.1 hypothetical protein [Xanthomonadaceae bacterium XH05]
MKYRALKARVAAAERRVGEHLDDAGRQIAVMRATTEQSMTPLRIIGSGFVGGFLIGWIRPVKHAAALPSLIRLLTGIPPLLLAIEPWLQPRRAPED